LLLGLEIILNDLGMNRLIGLDQTVECVWVTVWLVASESVHFDVAGFCKYSKGPCGVIKALTLI